MSKPKVPVWVAEKAAQALKEYTEGRSQSRHLKTHYEVINVCSWYRLVRRHGSDKWRLMTHEAYSKLY